MVDGGCGADVKLPLRAPAQDAAARPSFKAILQKLYDMKRGGVAEALEAARPRGNYNPTTDCGCVVM